MTAFMPAGCERLLTSLILTLVIELGLQRMSGAVSPSDISPYILGMTWILRATLHVSASCS